MILFFCSAAAAKSFVPQVVGVVAAACGQTVHIFCVFDKFGINLQGLGFKINGLGFRVWGAHTGRWVDVMRPQRACGLHLGKCVRRQSHPKATQPQPLKF